MKVKVQGLPRLDVHENMSEKLAFELRAEKGYWSRGNPNMDEPAHLKHSKASVAAAEAARKQDE